MRKAPVGIPGAPSKVLSVGCGKGDAIGAIGQVTGTGADNADEINPGKAKLRKANLICEIYQQTKHYASFL